MEEKEMSLEEAIEKMECRVKCQTCKHTYLTANECFECPNYRKQGGAIDYIKVNAIALEAMKTKKRLLDYLNGWGI